MQALGNVPDQESAINLWVHHSPILLLYLVGSVLPLCVNYSF